MSSVPHYGRILTPSPLSVPSGGLLTLAAPANGKFKFQRGATLVTFKLGSLAQISVNTGGIRHKGDFEISLYFPQISAGSYQCHVTSGLDLAETAQPVACGGFSAGILPGDFGAVLAPPAPSQARPGEVVTIASPADSSFTFDPWATYVTFGGAAGAVYQVTVPPSQVTNVDARRIRLPLPALPPGAYSVRVESGGQAAACSAPQVVLEGAAPGTAQRRATPAPRPALSAPSGAVPPAKLTVNAPYSLTPLPPGPVVLGPGAPPIHPGGTPPSPFTRIALNLKALFPGGRTAPIERAVPAKDGQPPPPDSGQEQRRGRGRAAAQQAPPVPPPLPSAPSHYAAGNQVEYLVDSAAFFHRLSEVMEEAAAAPGNTGYVHMALWACDERTVLDAAGKTFLERARAVGASKKELKLLLWSPGGAQGFTESVKRTNAKCKQALEALRLPSIEVQLFGHDLPFGTQHHCIVIAQAGERTKVLVSGMGLLEGHRDSAPHADRPHRHDVGVMFSGPAAVSAESHWAALWTQAGGGQPKGASAAVAPAQAGGEASLFVAVTQPPRLSLRDELIARIQLANHFAYLEGPALYDPDVMTALGQRLRSKRDASQPFEAILLAPHQSLSGPQAWLHYVTYCHLSFMSCTAFTYVDGNNTITVSRSMDGKSAWSFDYGGGAFGIGNWYEDSTVRWDTGITTIKSIRAFAGETLMYTLESAIAATPNTFNHIYAHSKVAIVDDAFAFIGSANLNPRSMLQDGELGVFIHGESVAAFRKTLWGEYFAGAAPTPLQWGVSARANHGTAQQGKMIAGQVYVMPLQFAVPQKEPGAIDAWLGAEQG